jgi:hypothetical protein
MTAVIEIEHKSISKKRNEKNDIFTVTKYYNSLQSDNSTNEDRLRLNCPYNEQQPTTSIGCSEKQLKKSEHLELNINKQLQKEESIHPTQTKIILKMMKYINNEEQYMQYFKYLVAFSDDRRNGKIISEFELLDEFSPSNWTSRCNEFGGKDLKGKQKMFKSRVSLINEVNNLSETSSDIQNIDLKNDAKHKLNGTKKHRIAMRIELLEKINSSYECGTTYDTLVDTIISLEEHFLAEC